MNTNTVFGLGTLHMGALLDRRASREVILKAIESGITFFDTAPLYGSTHSEEILGEVLSEARQEVFVCTKVGLSVSKRSDQRFGVEVVPLDEANIRASVERSLKRLKREAIDLLMLHAFDPTTPLEKTLEALNKLYREGKIKSFGCSNYNPSQLKQLLKQGKQEIPFHAAQCHYNLIEQRAGSKFIPLCETNQVWVVVNRALARGALSGQYGIGQELPKGSRASISPRVQKWLTLQRLNLLNSLSLIAKEHRVSLTQIALKWLFKNHSQMIVLLGVRNKEQLEGCLQANAADLDSEIFRKIELVLQNNQQDVLKYPPRYFEK